MILDDILAHNRTFAGSIEPRALPAEPARHACVVTCMDSRLVDFVTRALGFGRGEADLVSTAGNTITPHDNAVLRSVALAAYLHHVKEVFVVGHTGCGAASDVLDFTNAMEAAGVTRAAVGSADLREFFGLIPTPEANVRRVCEVLRQSPLIPPEVLVHGLVLDLKTGQLALVSRGEARPPRPREAARPMPAADIEPARTPDVHLAEEPAGPVSLFLGPSAPTGAASPSASQAAPEIVLRPPVAEKPGPGPSVEVPVRLLPPETVPVAPSSPMITIDIEPAAARKKPPTAAPARPKAAGRPLRPRPRPGESEDVDIRLGPIVRRRPPRR